MWHNPCMLKRTTRQFYSAIWGWYMWFLNLVHPAAGWSCLLFFCCISLLSHSCKNSFTKAFFDVNICPPLCWITEAEGDETEIQREAVQKVLLARFDTRLQGTWCGSKGSSPLECRATLWEKTSIQSATDCIHPHTPAHFSLLRPRTKSNYNCFRLPFAVLNLFNCCRTHSET